MRVLIFFDLPSVTSNDLKQYNGFRKTLINEGFIMMQESVYCKLALNMSIVNSIRNKISKRVPKKGIVQLLVITEKQFASIEYYCGDFQTNKINNTDRLIVL